MLQYCLKIQKIDHKQNSSECLTEKSKEYKDISIKYGDVRMKNYFNNS
jgi:hypothetical protein